jgi:hypothetical protein
MAIDPRFGIEEGIDPETGLPMSDAAAAPLGVPGSPMPSMEKPSNPAPAPMGAPPAMDPNVKDYIMKKFNLGDYSDDKRKALEEDAEPGIGNRIGAVLMALGGGNGMDIIKQGQAQKEAKLNQFDKRRQQKMQDVEFERTQRDDQQAQEKLKREMDPNSPESKIAQDLAKSMGMSPEQADGLTAAKFKDFSPALSKKYDIAQRSLDREEQRKDRESDREFRRDDQRLRRDELAGRRDEVRAEKEQKLKTPYGLANTEDDAKKLKEAHESKANFDSKIQEMINLRKQYGGEVFNREAVARGKQLSKDLLLEYKNMAKLGVLSAADEKIINAIIPDDPLEFSPSSLVGQDPILHKLEKFKEDSNKDFATRVQTRTREGIANYESGKTPKEGGGYPKQVRKGNQVATVSSPEEEKEAKAEGFE